jgi:2-polyprenyl-3-methyl-5-hydroxy-6-metoxy-1,4-benzoquinol methylase
LKVINFDIKSIDGYPFTASDEARDEYNVYKGHPLIDPYFESNSLIKYFYWKKVRIVLGLDSYDPAATVIDVGCGPGIFVPTLADNFRKVYGLDINPDDLRIATAIKESLDLANVEIIQSDIAHLSIGNGAVDIVFSMDALEHIVELDVALDKISDTLKDGGQLVVCAPTENWINDFSRRIMGYEKPKTHFHTSKDIERAASRRFQLQKKARPFHLPHWLSVVEMFLFVK